jgi:diadenosine tetraphosphate (Ap4A) HIT family hydrolase
MRKAREVRTPETEAKYRAYLAEQKSGHCPFCIDLNERVIIKKFKHWFISENLFPYDRVYSLSHMLIPLRHVENYWDWSDEERQEFLEIRRELAEAKGYDELLENFPVARTQIHYHLHLLAY